MLSGGDYQQMTTMSLPQQERLPLQLHQEREDWMGQTRPGTMSSSLSPVAERGNTQDSMSQYSAISDVIPEVAVERAFKSYVETTWTKEDEYNEPIFLPIQLDIPRMGGRRNASRDVAARSNTTARTLLWNVLERKDPTTEALKICSEAKVDKMNKLDEEKVGFVENQIREQLLQAGVIIKKPVPKRKANGTVAMDNCRTIRIRVNVRWRNRPHDEEWVSCCLLLRRLHSLEKVSLEIYELNMVTISVPLVLVR